VWKVLKDLRENGVNPLRARRRDRGRTPQTPLSNMDGKARLVRMIREPENLRTSTMVKLLFAERERLRLAKDINPRALLRGFFVVYFI